MQALLFSLFLLLANNCYSQVFIESAPVGTAAKGEYNFYGTGTLNKSILYNRIKGSPFWNDEWQLASLYNEKKRYAILPVKLNLATHEVYYLLNNRELVATPDNLITAIVFHKNNDTSITTAAFRKESPLEYSKEQPLTAYFQILNTGRYQLLKYTDRYVGSADSLFGTQKRFFFRDNVSYFIRSNEMVQPIKKLNAESFLSLLPSSSAYKDWIKAQKLSFKKEEDLLTFLTYYNNQLAATPK